MSSKNKKVKWGNSKVLEFNNTTNISHAPTTSAPIKPNGPNETNVERKHIANSHARYPALAEQAAENARLASRSQEEINRNTASNAAEQATIQRRDAQVQKHFGVSYSDFMQNHLLDHYEAIEEHGGIDGYLDHLNKQGGRRKRSKTKKRRTQRNKRKSRKH